jgi:hypothetical protein
MTLPINEDVRFWLLTATAMPRNIEPTQELLIGDLIKDL